MLGWHHTELEMPDFSKFFKFCLILGGFILLGMTYGWVASNLWAWFVLPLFPKLPAISTGQAMGLATLVMLYNGSAYRHMDREEMGMSLIFLVARPFFLLIAGWILHGFIGG